MQKIMTPFMLLYMKVVMGAPGYTEAEITGLEPNHSIRWRGRVPSRKGDIMRMDWELVLEPNGDGTQVTQHCEMLPPEDSPFKNMVDADQVERSSIEAIANLELLKQVVEQ